MYTGIQTSMIAHAAKLSSLGYQVGFATGKELAGKFQETKMVPTWFGAVPHKSMNKPPDKWDGISIILDGLVCVDFDTEFFDIGWGRNLPPTLKEKSPRGYHLYYRLPADAPTNLDTKIKWQAHIDLLVKGTEKLARAIKTRYGKRDDNAAPEWDRHVVCAPTPGYKHIYPDNIPHIDQLPVAPQWLIEELSK